MTSVMIQVQVKLEHCCRGVGFLGLMVLHPSKIYHHIRMGADLWQCTLIVTLLVLPHERPGQQHHDLISHSVTLSWYWANQSLLRPNNAKHLARKQQVSSFYVIGLIQPGFKPMRSPNLTTSRSTNSATPTGLCDLRCCLNVNPQTITHVRKPLY